MGVRIHYPTDTRKHKQALLVCQGRCINANNLTFTLTKNGVAVPNPGKQLPVIHKQSWAFRIPAFDCDAGAHYVLTVTDATPPAAAAVAAAPGAAAAPAPPAPPQTDTVVFAASPPPDPPSALAGPIITYPLPGDTVAPVFYPYGLSATLLEDETTFSDSTNSVDWLGTVSGPDPAGSNYCWSGTVDASSFPMPDAGCNLTASNAGGTTTHGSLTVSC